MGFGLWALLQPSGTWHSLRELPSFPDLLFRVHTSAAIFGPAKAQGKVIWVAIVKVVVVREFFSRKNLSNCTNDHSAVDLVGLAVRITGMIDEGGYAITINHALAIGQAKEVGSGRVLVNRVGFRVAKARARIFGDDRAAFYRRGSVDTVGVNLRSANNEGHSRD
jgi:hypothetical protein